jgi:hypothetical protein
MKKFKKNLKTLLNLFDTEEEMIDFLVSKNAFDENFVQRMVETKDVDYLKNNDLTIEEINDNFKYDVTYNQHKKINVDITKNDIFSYYDTEQELILKMNRYIITEQYEKAQTMKNYFDTIELKYN